MPKLHPTTGLACCGTAGGRVSVGSRTGEATVLADGGATHWFDADTIFYLGPADGAWPGPACVMAVDRYTGQRTVVDEREAFCLAVGGGRWQAGRSGAGGSFGSCGDFAEGTIGRTMTDFRGAAAADGTIALVDRYHGVRNGFRLARADGTVSSLYANGWDAYHLTVIDRARALWPQGEHWGVIGLPEPAWLRGSLRACYVEVGGIAYLVHEMKGAGLVARRADSTRGVVLDRSGRCYHYDAIAWQGGLRVAWASIDGEPPGSLVVTHWDLQSGLEELGPAPTPPTPTEETMIRAFEHPFWFAPFYSHSEKYGVTPPDRHVGNAIVVVEREGDPAVLRRELMAYLPLGLPLIVQGDVQPLPEAARNQTVAYWVGAGTIDALGAKVDAALRQAWPLPVIAYLDARDWPEVRPAWLTDAVWPSVQAYPRASEMRADFAGAIDGQISRVVGYGGPWALTPRTDDPDQDGGGWTLDQIVDGLPLYERWIRDRQPAAVMPFADRRGHGLAYHPALWAWARAVQYAVPCGRPGRYDWRPPTADVLTVLRNKFGQSRRLKLIEPWLADEILKRFEDTPAPEPPVPEPPDPGTGPTAPDARWAVERAMREHPDLDTQDEEQGGRIVDYACALTGELRWGRKARNEDGTNKNRDAMCWKRRDGRFEIYDVILGADPGGEDPARFATWDFKGTFAAGENGWWTPPDPV